MIHIASLRIDTAERVRQLCAWCGTLLVDTEYSRTAFQLVDPHAGTIPAWPVGAPVSVNGAASFVVDPEQVDAYETCIGERAAIKLAEPILTSTATLIT